MPDEFDIQKLLRLKRHEQPPPEYFEDFLREFHCRQREELLRQPLWRIALERMQAFFGELTVPRVAYAGATAAVLVSAGIASYNILNPVGESHRIASLGATTTTGLRGAEMAQVRQVSAASPSSRSALAWNHQQFQMLQADVSILKAATQSNGSVGTPRYVIDTRPVSYEPPSSF